MNWFIKKLFNTLSRNNVSYNKTREDAKRDYYELGIPKEPKMPTPKPPAWFAHWNKGFKQELDERFSSLETKVDENSKMIKENSKNIKKILDCPTIQQEIQ